MSDFKRDQLEMFLGVVRKYMQVRGPMSQKDLAELTEVGVSTMSRFLNMKSSELNAQLIAKIVAKLEIPLYEIIDFIEEDYTDKFKRLVQFFKEEDVGDEQEETGQKDPGTFEESFVDSLSSGGTAKKDAKANVKIGGKTRTISFESEGEGRNSEKSIREKLQSLSPRQKAYMADFLNLDMEGRDLVVDLGNNLFRYFRQKGMDF